MKVKRGQIYLADLSQGYGSEQGGVRPVLAVSYTHLFGGSVNQEVIKKAKDYDNIRIVSGVNFPLLLELAIRLHTEITDEELKNIIEQSKSQMLMVETKLETEFKDDFDF